MSTCWGLALVGAFSVEERKRCLSGAEDPTGRNSQRRRKAASSQVPGLCAGLRVGTSTAAARRKHSGALRGGGTGRGRKKRGGPTSHRGPGGGRRATGLCYVEGGWFWGGPGLSPALPAGHASLKGFALFKAPPSPPETGPDPQAGLCPSPTQLGRQEPTSTERKGGTLWPGHFTSF